MGRLDEIDLSARIDSDEYEKRLAAAQTRFLELRLQLGGQTTGGQVGPGLLVVVEGPDAAGKGGASRRMVQPLDPRHFDVYAYSKPTERELRHHFLWRFWTKIPGRGGMCVFDRSWYGRVLVERVEGFATEKEWRRGYEAIRRFEQGMVLEGVILVKFWVHVSQDEQLKRFEQRQHDPLKKWKLNDEDWRNRTKWPLYVEAIEDMFAETDHDLAPWDLVSGEQKKWGRIAVLETLNDRIVEGIERWNS